MERLFEMVRHNDMDKLMEEMTGTDIADIDSPDKKSENCDTLLCTAVRNGHLRVAEMLLKRGASPNGSAETAAPPLTSACEDHSARLVELLLSYGANVNYVSERADPALISSISSGTPGIENRSVINLLLEAGANTDIGSKKLRPWYMRCTGHTDNWNKPFEEYGISGSTPLMLACRRGFLSVVTTLLDAGADQNLADNLGNTALHYAVHCYSSKMATLDKQFHIIQHHSFPQVVQALIESSALVDTVNKNKSTALDITLFHLDLLVENQQFHNQYKLDIIVTDYFQTISMLISAGCPSPASIQYTCSSILGKMSVYFWYFEVFFKSCQRAIWQEKISDLELSRLRAAFDDVLRVTAHSGIRLTPDDVTLISEIVPEFYEDDFRIVTDWLSGLAQNCYSLKQMCVIELRRVMRKPLRTTINSRKLGLPNRVKASILLQDSPVGYHETHDISKP